MVENAPRTREGQIAWSVCCQPGVWTQSIVAGLSGAQVLTRGLDMVAAMTQAQALYPGLDLHLLHTCLSHIETERIDVERRLRLAQNNGTPH